VLGVELRRFVQAGNQRLERCRYSFGIHCGPRLVAPVLCRSPAASTAPAQAHPASKVISLVSGDKRQPVPLVRRVPG
jgi:hypothetical protein